MNAIKVVDGVHMLSIGVGDLLFEEMWEIPNGVTLNSYIVKGEKTAIIDGMCGWDGVPETLFELLEKIEVKPEDIDYVIVNHMEPDHTGWIDAFKAIVPDFKIYCTRPAAKMMNSFYGKADNIVAIKDGDELDLGGGKVLKFATVPNVHWPDTMFTYELSTGTAFTCDMFGSFGKTDTHVFDDVITEEDKKMFYEETIRYYANVLCTFNKAAIKATAKLKEFGPKIVAPGHGVVYRENPDEIIKIYDEIEGFLEGSPKKELTLLWGSMYGMTEIAVEFIKNYLESKGVTTHILRMPYVSPGEVLSKVIRSAGVVLAAPTYENNLFPAAGAMLDELAKKKVIDKKAVYIGSYGWSGGAFKEFKKINEERKMKWEILEGVAFEGRPIEEDLDKVKAALDLLVESM